jgi:hypothetical protein
MSAVSEAPVTKRQILPVRSYGVPGTGVVDAVAENAKLPRCACLRSARLLRCGKL